MTFKRSGSHAGEDEWILTQFPAGYLGTAVELGAHDGIYLSNTLMLEERGWTVLCIEPNPRLQEHLRAHRKLVMNYGCGEHPISNVMFYYDPNVFMETQTTTIPGPRLKEAGVVPVYTVEQCLDHAGFTRLDVLSIDVDGDEHGILKGANVPRWLPRVVVIEENHVTDGLTDEHLKPLGYHIATKLGHNNLYLRSV